VDGGDCSGNVLRRDLYIPEDCPLGFGWPSGEPLGLHVQIAFLMIPLTATKVPWPWPCVFFHCQCLFPNPRNVELRTPPPLSFTITCKLLPQQVVWALCPTVLFSVDQTDRDKGTGGLSCRIPAIYEHGLFIRA